jgi:hypothetical protein
MRSVVEDTLISVETVVRAQDKLGFRLLDVDKPSDKLMCM